MARELNVKGFSAASAAYVKSAVERANTNHNRYLTKAEAAALPKDLRDSYAKFQSESSNGTVGAKSFVEGYAHLVESAAKRADVDGNGVISATEVRQLPVELRDNAVNYSGLTPAAEPPVITSVSLPLSQTNIEKVRAAMTDFVENQLTARKPSELEPGEFEYNNSEWAELVRESGGDGEHQGLKNEALQLAKSWTPNSDWPADTTSRGGVYFTGAFDMITMFVELEKGKAPSFQTEID